MDAIWHCGFIKYMHKKSLNLKDIHADMVAILGDDIKTLSIEQKRTSRFKRRIERLENDPRLEEIM